MKSEFGKGLGYCLGLFLCHSERSYHTKNKDDLWVSDDKYQLWFNGAADHLYELEIPIYFSKYLQARLKRFQTKCIDWRMNKYTQEDKTWAIQEAKDLLRLIDKHHGIDTKKGQWQ